MSSARLASRTELQWRRYDLARIVGMIEDVDDAELEEVLWQAKSIAKRLYEEERFRHLI